MFYDHNTNRLYGSHDQLLAAYPDAGPLDNEPDRNALGLYLVREQPPAYDPLTHTLAFDVVELVGGIYHARYVLTQLPPDQVRASLLQAVSAKRWAVETGGLTLPGGATVGTTIDDQNRITSVIANAQMAGVVSVDFKAQSGWVTLSLEHMRGIAAAIALHVQACFSAERAHHEAIAAASETELMAYDINTEWPV